VFACLAIFAGFATGQNKSVYTSTNTKVCRTIESTSKNAGYYRGLCPGVGGYKLELIEGDIRQTLNVITPAKKKQELKFWEFYGSFSSIGDKVEWRTNRGVPVALIARYYVADPEGVKKDTAFLIISKIGPRVSCVTDVVEPKPKQNEQARILADAASTKPCKQTE
jgi:hypothetical protein